MSFKTYADYNADNVIKTIESANDNIDTDRSMTKLDKLLKGSMNVLVHTDGLHSDRYERTMDNRWYNWHGYFTVSDDEFKRMLSSLDENEYEVVKI